MIQAIKGYNLSGSGVLDDINSWIKGLEAGLDSLIPFFGTTETIGWEAANRMCAPLKASLETSLSAKLTADQLTTMARELPQYLTNIIVVREKGLEPDDYEARVTRYKTALTTEVQSQPTTVKQISYAVWLFLMQRMEFYAKKDIAKAPSEVQALLTQATQNYMVAQKWVEAGFQIPFLGSLDSQTIMIIAAVGIGLLVLKGSRHTKVGA